MLDWAYCLLHVSYRMKVAQCYWTINTGTGCPGRSRSLPLRGHSKPTWMHSYVTCSRWQCFCRGVDWVISRCPFQPWQFSDSVTKADSKKGKKDSKGCFGFIINKHKIFVCSLNSFKSAYLSTKGNGDFVSAFKKWSSLKWAHYWDTTYFPFADFYRSQWYFLDLAVSFSLKIQIAVIRLCHWKKFVVWTKLINPAINPVLCWANASKAHVRPQRDKFCLYSNILKVCIPSRQPSQIWGEGIVLWIVKKTPVLDFLWTLIELPKYSLTLHVAKI